MTSQKELVLAYRHLYQHCLRAVQYSKPARYTARDRLRQAFRANPPSSFDPVRIQTTLEFLDGAARAKGLEHKIVKNLLHVWAKKSNVHFLKTGDSRFQPYAYQDFDHTVAMLNQTMGTCI